MYPLVQLMLYTVLLMTAGGPSVGQPCTGWGEAVSMVTCLAGVVVLALMLNLPCADKDDTAESRK